MLAILLMGAGGAAADSDAAETSAALPGALAADADLATLRAALADGTLSAEQLLQRTLERIRALDREGLRLNSLVALSPRAASEPGGAVDSAASNPTPTDVGRSDGVLAGIPLVVGDTIDVQGLPTTAGSATLRGHRPTADAAPVAALRAAGAVLFAKANTSELGLGGARPGYSSAGGQTLNPYNPDRVTSGVAAAIAAGLAPAGIGSDGAGDLRSAAAQTGLVAIRPTRDALNPLGWLPAPLSVDRIGPLARRVADAALLLSVLEEADSDGSSAQERGPKGSLAIGTDQDLSAMRFGVFKALTGGHEAVNQAFDQSIRRLRSDGAELVQLDLPARFVENWSRWRELLRETELRDQLNAYLKQVGEGRPSDLIALLRVSESPLIRGSESPVDPAAMAILMRAAGGPGLASPEYLEVLSAQLPALRSAILALIDEHALDAIVFPTRLCAAPSRLDQYDTSYDCDAADPELPVGLATASGLPEITVPMGQTDQGLPLGLSLLGPADSEWTLVLIAARFERLRGEPPWPALVPKRISGED
jgi:amidase